MTVGDDQRPEDEPAGSAGVDAWLASFWREARASLLDRQREESERARVASAFDQLMSAAFRRDRGEG